MKKFFVLLMVGGLLSLGACAKKAEEAKTEEKPAGETPAATTEPAKTDSASTVKPEEKK